MNLLKIKTDDNNISVFPVKSISFIYYSESTDNTIINLKDGHAIAISGKCVDQISKLITSLTNGKVGNIGEW